jgi:hypothetical protein
MDTVESKPREREPWTDADTQNLITCWYNNDPVLLISIKLKRTPSSIQTQASRKGLPSRKIDNQRHRKRWTPAEDTILDQIVYQKSGFTALQSYASSRSRTLDAVVSRIMHRHGQSCLHQLCAGALSPDILDVIAKSGTVQTVEKPKEMYESSLSS